MKSLVFLGLCRHKVLNCTESVKPNLPHGIDGLSPCFNSLTTRKCHLPFQLAGHRLLREAKINRVNLRTTMVFLDTVVLCSLLLNSLLIIFVFLFSVKLRIKSFNIPELFIKVPENATIGSLKVNTRLAYKLNNESSQ